MNIGSIVAQIEENDNINQEEVYEDDTFECCSCHNILPLDQQGIKLSAGEVECIPCYSSSIDSLSELYGY
jgi:hypothetical protein